MEDVTVLNLSTGVSVKNINELRQYIKALKEDLQDENATVAQNAATAEELRAAQGALRDAMYATTKTAEDYKAQVDAIIGSQGELVKDINGQTASYNDLVHVLADLKSAWRATTDEAERAVLTEQIDKVNSKLKQMDASVGTFSRNVGNYTNQVSKWGETMQKGFSATAGSAKTLINPISNVTNGFKAMSATPVVAVLGLIANALTKVTAGMKSTAEGTAQLNRILAAFKPIGDAFKRGLQDIGIQVGNLGNKIIDLLDKYDLLSERARQRIKMQEDMSALKMAQLENIKTEADLERDAAAYRDKMNDKETYTLEQRKQYYEEYRLTTLAIYKNRKELAEAAYRAEKAEHDLAGDKYKDIEKLNRLYAESVKAAAELSDAERTMRRERDRVLKDDKTPVPKVDPGAAKQAGVEMGEAIAEGIDEGLALHEVDLSRLDNFTDPALQARIEAEQKAAEEKASLDALMVEQEAATLAEIDALWEDFEAKRDADYEREQARKEGLVTLAFGYATAVSSILESISDTMEAEAAGTEKYAQQVKNLRIASAVIDSISGAISAYMNGVKTIPIPSWAGIALGAVQAASVLAAGMAQVAKIRNTQISRSGSASSAGSAAAPMAAQAPAIPQTAQQSAVIRNAYNTERLNTRMADQRVYILQSDLEASGKQVAVREAESTF